MGMHTSDLDEGKDAHYCEILRRVWLGVIIQDNTLSMALGRPRLILPPHIRALHEQKRLPSLTDDVVYFYQFA
jgi:hypothetical protein